MKAFDPRFRINYLEIRGIAVACITSRTHSARSIKKKKKNMDSNEHINAAHVIGTSACGKIEKGRRHSVAGH